MIVRSFVLLKSGSMVNAIIKLGWLRHHVYFIFLALAFSEFAQILILARYLGTFRRTTTFTAA